MLRCSVGGQDVCGSPKEVGLTATDGLRRLQVTVWG